MRYYGYFHECGPQNVTPLGHLKAILEKQQNLSSHFKEQGYPFDTPMWDGGTGKVVSCPVISHDPTVEIPETWWPYEQSAYLLDGVLRLGILFNDQEKIELFRRNAAYVANHPDQDGLLGHCYPGNNISEWPMAVFFRAVHAYCELTQDEELKKAFISHYTALSAQKICSEFRNICNLEGLLKCYEWSGDDQLLEKALEAFHLYDKCYSPPSENEFELPWSRLTSGRNFVIHGVSFSEFLKLPVMLYLYSGDRKYLDGAEKALADVLARHEQITGLPCSIENFAGRDPLQGYETCVITDFTWALGYFLMASGKAEYADRIEKIIFNALPGAVTEDFCTLQYLSSPNQMVAADYANHSFFLRGTACFRQFRADHRPQCCAGNIHRILPNFAMRSWMVDAEGNPAAVFYVPSSYRGTLHGQEYVITEETSYPDDETIRFRFSMTGSLEMAFSCRIPGWCRNASILINGVPADVAPECGTFCRILRKWHDGDEVTVTLPMEIVQKQDRYWSYYERGPLVYSLPIPFTEVREYQSVYAPRNLLPAGRWNYGVSPGTPASFENGTLRVKGFPVSGFDALVQGRYSPELPLWGKRCGDDEMLTLIPYGQAKLRITAFPDGIEREVVPVFQVLAGKPFPYDHFAPLSEQGPGLEELLAEDSELQMDSSGYYDLLHHFGPMKDVLCGMHFRIWSEKEQDAFIAAGVSDGAEGYLNNEHCFSIEPPCDGEFMAPFIYPVRLHHGFNDLVLKVCEGPTLMQYRSAWGARIQVYTQKK